MQRSILLAAQRCWPHGPANAPGGLPKLNPGAHSDFCFNSQEVASA